MTEAKRRRRGWGAIRKLPSGRYQASVTGPDLVRHPCDRTFETRMDAEAWLAAERRRMEQPGWVPPKARAKRAKATQTLATYAPGAIERRRVKGEPLAPRTRAHYRGLFDRAIAPTLGDVPLDELTPGQVVAWFDGLDRSHPTRRAHAYSLLRVIMNQAIEDRLIVENPCTVQGAGKTKRARHIEPLTPAEVAALADAMPPRLRAFVLVCAWVGLRYGEAAELRRKDINLTRGRLRVERAVVRVDRQDVVGDPKSEAGVRTVTIPPHILDDLAQHLDTYAAPGPDGLVFPRATDPTRHMIHTEVSKAFRAAASSVGLAGTRVHDLRHTSAVLAAQTGATLPELMARLGHSTEKAAMRYQHAARDRDAQIAAAMTELSTLSE